MFFSTLGRLTQKYKFLIIALWVVAAVVYFIVAPPLSEVGVTDQSQFLPENTESAHARILLNSKFDTNSDSSSNSALIVVFNKDGLNEQDRERAKALRDWLVSNDAPEAIDRVISVFDGEALQSSLESRDHTTMMINVYFSVPALSDTAKQAIQDIRAQFKQYPESTFYLSGSAGLMYDMFDSVQKSIDKTTYITLILVVVLLLIVYRSPFASIVPLLAIGASFLVTRGIIGFLAQAGVAVSTITDAYMVVTIFGVGTDYCLFIVSRFREELALGDQKDKIEYTMRRIGPIIVASAITVVIAFLCLSISKFGMTRTSGWALAIGITVTLLSGLTLVPALMSLFGRYLFWPSMKLPKPKLRKYGWSKIGQWIAKHPVWIAVPIIVILAFAYWAMPGFSLTANTLSQLPKSVESADGLHIVREHFPVGEMSPLYLILQSEQGLSSTDSLEKIKTISIALSQAQGISRVDYFAVPGERLNTLGLQVKNLSDMLNTGVPDLSKFSQLEVMPNELQNLALHYPGVIQSTNFNAVTAGLKGVSAQLPKFSATPPADLPRLIMETQQTLYALSGAITSLSNEFELTENSLFTEWLRANYISADGTAVKMNLVLKKDPYSDESAETVKQIRESIISAVNDSGLSNVEHYVGGDAAISADMLKTSEDDFTLVIVVTSVGILAVIIILLRSVLAPLYMVATVLFNYGVTLGITAWIFLDLLEGDSLIFLLPVLVFVMLAAVGADYNIFLVSRIREEYENKSIKEAVQHSVSQTGGVITSCGIILAGTFATMISSSLPVMVQIGTPIAVGVLIDTFLVRALLVPSLAVILGRWNWWPSRLFRKHQPTTRLIK
jgi:RND superfamily putative drug exporter